MEPNYKTLALEMLQKSGNYTSKLTELPVELEELLEEIDSMCNSVGHNLRSSQVIALAIIFYNRIKNE